MTRSAGGRGPGGALVAASLAGALLSLPASLRASPLFPAPAGGGASPSAASVGDSRGADRGRRLPSPRLYGTGRLGRREAAKVRAIIRERYPLSPAEIRALLSYRRRLLSAARALPPPVLDVGQERLDLEPGGAIPTVWVTPGYVSSIVFRDDTGAAWPITSVTLGDPRGFSVNVPAVGRHDLLTITPRAAIVGASTSVVLTLEGRAKPIVLQAIESDARNSALLTLRATSAGPLARPSVYRRAPLGASRVLTAFLEGVPPRGSRELGGTGGLARAWAYGGRIYLRTREILLWPAWLSDVRGAGGVKVFALPGGVHTLLVSVAGRTRTLELRREGG